MAAEIITNSAEETIAYGRALASELSPPLLILLRGDLGAGKTTLVKGIAEGFQAARAEEVTSPTFTILHEYSGGRLPVFHFDFFRLDNGEERLRQIGLDDYFFGEGVSVI